MQISRTIIPHPHRFSTSTTDQDTSPDYLITQVSKKPLGTPLLRKVSEGSYQVTPKFSLSQTNSPFGPKTRSHIIPAKHFEQCQVELDQLENFHIWSDIGRGSYAVVKFATQKPSGQKVAIKIYEKSKLSDPLREKSVKNEIKVLKKLNHPNIVQFISEVSKEKNLYLIMEYVKGCSLQAHLQRQRWKRLEEPEAVGIFVQFIKALAYCHRVGVVHRDIKLENVLINNEGVVKVIDFGFATCCKRGRKTFMYCGTPNYMAPEIVKKEEYEGFPVDVWAAGVLLYLLVTGGFPFGSNKEAKVFKNILKNQIVFPEYLSCECKDLIKKMLESEPEKRILAEEVLVHPWVCMKGRVIWKNLQSNGDNIDVCFEEDE